MGQPFDIDNVVIRRFDVYEVAEILEAKLTQKGARITSWSVTPGEHPTFVFTIEPASDEAILESHGWTVECQSPFEITHQDGSQATGQAARYVVEAIKAGWDDDE